MKLQVKALCRLSALLVALSALAACNQYDVRVNDRVVYTPDPLFSDYAASDPALQRCLDKAISREKITSAAQLRALDCRGAGITELTGLQVFTGLRELLLADNAVSDLSPLLPLSSLEILSLADNAVSDPRPLYELLSLRSLDLSGNTGLSCPPRQDLLRVVELTLPTHCAR
ncbi:hypothetical protein E4634_15505 [Mangrovimicrobium sediminis]|uniref:Leucine-rich repeat domain-containing protein n=1 Tax=Mangrovimicrobium sediminis TaxID=2562682 RepID=A0A4Z0LXS3_9GAMM|nr:hypothetical protein [Haliea sp. SAOS-164]TGD72079.1 hypothetical protein E4634_15505 [Haliea sp. SAOS-164]